MPMFWDRYIDLIKLEGGCTEEGAPTENEVSRTQTFANANHIGFEKWVAAKSIGLHADAAIEIRSIDYNGENACEIDGQMYDIERVYDRGEWTNLTLKRRLGTEKSNG